jgi:hypothetical protein
VGNGDAEAAAEVDSSERGKGIDVLPSPDRLHI